MRRRCRRGRRRAGGTPAGRRTRRQDAAELGVPRAERRPLRGGELGGLEQRAGVQVGVHRGQRDQVAGVHRGEQGRDLAAFVQGWSQSVPPRCRAVPAVAPGQGEAAAAELVAQLLGVGRQVAERAELDGGVAGGRGLVEELVPRHLLRVVGEPDAPGVGGGAQPQVRRWPLW